MFALRIAYPASKLPILKFERSNVVPLINFFIVHKMLSFLVFDAQV